MPALARLERLHLRHAKRSSIGFVDDYVAAMEAAKRYYSNTSWTDLALGGGQ